MVIYLNVYHSDIKFSFSIPMDEREESLKSISSCLRNKTQMEYQSDRGYIDENGRYQRPLISFKEDTISDYQFSFKIGRNRYMIADYFDELAIKDLPVN